MVCGSIWKGTSIVAALSFRLPPLAPPSPLFAHFPSAHRSNNVAPLRQARALGKGACS
eukprot:CAMPEP_0169473868 /NCGR_PEP_ID=MMETSP1042-20121227/25943_1 /TAXON_ID=464988 /ORGANISM="Hemiselmis andersenii, Strain CCMP1180" /LENGTH=57 /DNA_ID=CAMNT_0009587841 /DNA_START=239 /DNA_END=412 /DNA_ORIENTATION=+